MTIICEKIMSSNQDKTRLMRLETINILRAMRREKGRFQNKCKFEFYFETITTYKRARWKYDSLSLDHPE